MGQPVVHFEIGGRDAAKASKFFSELFGWTMSAYGPATMIDTGSKSGIMGHLTALGHEPHHYVTVYVEVDNLQAYLDKAGKLGGKTIVPPTEVPGAGTFAWLNDLDGNIIGLWKPAPQ